MILAEGWAGIMEHAVVPFVSYPYEWTFSMLKDAALLQLHLLEKSLENGWILKDATPYNIQWVGPRPCFIDLPSFEPWIEGEPWVGYRQFCSMFLTPLMLRAHLGIDHLPLLRSYLDGIPPTEAVKFFSRTQYLKKGVMSHIVFPAKVENSIAQRERDDAPAQRRSGRKQSLAMVLGLVQSLTRLVRSLTIPIDHTDWSQYDKTHSYKEPGFRSQAGFCSKACCREEAKPCLGYRMQHRHFLAALQRPLQPSDIAGWGSQRCRTALPRRKGQPGVQHLATGHQSGQHISRSGMGRDRAPCIGCALQAWPCPLLALIHHIRLSANTPTSSF